jgi:hypothetical protein
VGKRFYFLENSNAQPTLLFLNVGTMGIRNPQPFNEREAGESLTMIILDIAFMVLIVAAIVALLGWGIVSDRRLVVSLTDGSQRRVRARSPFERAPERARARPARRASRLREIDVRA